MPTLASPIHPTHAAVPMLSKVLSQGLQTHAGRVANHAMGVILSCDPLGFDVIWRIPH